MILFRRDFRVFAAWNIIAIIGRCATLLCLSMVPYAAAAQGVPKWDGKETSRIIVQYEKLIAGGALLTPAGWKRACKLFSQPARFPENGVISLTSTGGILGETSRLGDQAEVQTKWTDYFGSIDSNLRYKAPDPIVVGTIYVYELVLTNGQWKIKGSPQERWTTTEKALSYLQEIRDKSRDPKLKMNADRTIKILKRLNKPCGQASAC